MNSALHKVPMFWFITRNKERKEEKRKEEKKN